MKKLFSLVAVSATMYPFEDLQQLDERVRQEGKPHRVLRILYGEFYHPRVYDGIEYLIMYHKAPIDTRDRHGNTALRYALFNYCAHTQKESADDENLMALDRAPHFTFIKSLLAHGAEFDRETYALFDQLQRQYHLSQMAIDRITYLYQNNKESFLMLRVTQIDTCGDVECQFDDSKVPPERPALRLFDHKPGVKTFKQHPRFAKSEDASSCKLL